MTFSFRSRPVLGFLLAGLLLGSIIWLSGPESLAQAKDVHPGYLVLVVAATGLIVLVATLRWAAVLHGLDPSARYPRGTLFRVVLAGLTLGLVVSVDVGSASSRMAFLTKGRKMPLEQAGFSTLLDRAFDVIVLFLLMPAAVLFIVGFLDAIGALVVMGLTFAIGVGGIVRRPQVALALFSRGFALGAFALKRVTRSRPAGAWASLRDVTLTPGETWRILQLSTIRFLLVGLRAWLVVLAVGMDLSAAQLLVILPLVQATLMVPITPGGLGVYEAGWYGVLLAIGAPADASLVFVVLHRVLSMLAVVGLFGITELGFFIRAKRLRSS